MYAEEFQSVFKSSQSAKDLSPGQILHQVEYLNEIRMILTHPFFTGHCPNCAQNLTISNRVLGESRCRSCGWKEAN